MSGKGQRGDSYYVERFYSGAVVRRPLYGRATTPERAARLATRYRLLGGEPGVVVRVTSASGHAWPAWIWSAKWGRWERGRLAL